MYLIDLNLFVWWYTSDDATESIYTQIEASNINHLHASISTCMMFVGLTGEKITYYNFSVQTIN